MGDDAGSIRSALEREGASSVRYVPHPGHSLAAEPERSGPYVISRHAAVLRADIVGFTGRTDVMAREGPIGAEKLAAVVDGFLRELASLAAERGGAFATLAGDAALFVWSAESEEERAAAVLGAADAGLSFQASLSKVAAPDRLMTRCSVGSGLLHRFRIGGRSGEWSDVLSGPALRDAVAAGLSAEPGEVALARPAWALVGVSCHRAGDRPDAVVVDRIAPSASLHPKPAETEARPGPSLPTRRAGRGEFRTVTAVFAVLRHPEHARPEDALKALQRAAALVQEILARFEGLLHQLRADEEGVTLIAVFGLPPLTHEDHASRATQAALTLHAEWSALGVTSSAGIATGRVFAATLWDGRLLTLVGPAMNLAARLMQLNAGVLCDAETVRAGRQHRRIAARELAPHRLKGKDAPVVAYVPYAIAADDPADTPRRPFIGRSGTLAALASAVAGVREGRGGMILLEGEAGIGKSAVVAQLRALVRQVGMAIHVGFGDETDHLSPFFAWRPIFHALFGTADATPEERSRRIVSGLGHRGSLAPLLSDVLELALSDSPETLQLADEARAASTRKLLLERLAAQSRMPTVLVLEDIHWLDTSSMSLLAEAAEANLPLLLLCTSRPRPADDEWLPRFGAVSGFRRLALEALTAGETGEMLASAFEATMVAPAVAEFVLSRTGGNPLFIEEIAPLLRARGLLVVRDGDVEIAGSTELAHEDLDRALASGGVPGTLEGIVLARFDRLPARQRRVLQLAAVMGQVFRLDDLRALPIPSAEHGLSDEPISPSSDHALEDGDALDRDMDELVAGGFLGQAGRETGSFRHAVIRDVIYGTLAFSERAVVHGRFAEILSARTGTENAAPDAVLGRHFGLAGEDRRAIPHLLRAAQDSLRIFANVEALALARDARERILRVAAEDKAAEGQMWRQREAEAELVLATANHRLSRYAEARAHAERMLRLLGLPVPRGRIALVGGIAYHAGLRLKRRFRPFASGGKADRTIYHPATLALEHLFEIYFFAGDDLRAVHSALLMVDVAERGSDRARRAHAYANLAGITGAVSLRSATRYYRQRALADLAPDTDTHARTWVSTVAALTYISVGDWAAADPLLDAAASAASAANDRRSWRAVAEFQSIVAALRDDLDGAYGHARAMLASAERDRDQRALVSIWRDLAHYSVRRSEWQELDRYVRLIGEQLEVGLTAEEEIVRLERDVFAAVLRLQSGEALASLELLQSAMEKVVSLRLSFPHYYWTILLIAAAALSLHDGAAGDLLRPQARAILNAACRELRRQGRSHPVARASSFTVNGIVRHLAGDRRRAERLWRQAISTATALSMPWEARMAARLLDAPGRPADNPGARSFLAGV